MGAHGPRRRPAGGGGSVAIPAAAPAAYARVVVEVAPAHLDRPFDYAVPDGVAVAVGQRVRVPFAGRRVTGWVVATGRETATDPARVKPILAVQGTVRWFDDDDLRLFRWVADRYCASLADVLRHALPPRVAAVEAEAADWGPPAAPAGAERPPCPTPAWRPYDASALLRAVWRPSGSAFMWRPLPREDVAALAGDLVARCLAAGRSALVLAPDPASPVPDAALALVGTAGVDLRPGATAGERGRYRAFLRCRTGHARVAAGERSAVFAPLRDLGLVLVDDEANAAYKERRSPRHHARDVALARARLAGATALVVADLPSARAWRLAAEGHLTPVTGDRGVERAQAPHVDVADLSRQATPRTRLAPPAGRALAAAVRGDRAAVVLATRGGQGAVLACRDCGNRLPCPVCDGALRPGGPDDGWACPACEWRGPAFACPACGGTRRSPLAAGAGRLAQEIARAHPRAEVVRMEGFDAPGPAGRPAIGVLTRGSVVARPAWLGREAAAVALVADADALLARPSLDAAEDALRLWLAVARWTDHVVVQTRQPRHPAVQALVRWDPDGFWRAECERRAALRYPPAASLVLVNAPAGAAAEVAEALREALPPDDEVLGPGPDGGVLVKSGDLRGTLDALAPLRHAWARADAKVRVDVDPLPTP
ncbi:MAG: hypothetical protein KY434_01100 [Actinobacteria bacterium]|nr:hypothetical protein [Actinomycetota bacterium]